MKVDGPRRLPCLLTAGQSLFTLGSPSLFVEGERKKETITWLYSCLVFSLLLILLLILFLFPFWKKYNSVRKGRRALILLPQQWHFKK